MSKFKVGDKVRVVRMSEYSLNVIEGMGARNPIGDTGTVVDIGYNRHMEQYGKGVEVYVKMDQNKDCSPTSSELWYEDYLEKID